MNLVSKSSDLLHMEINSLGPLDSYYIRVLLSEEIGFMKIGRQVIVELCLYIISWLFLGLQLIHVSGNYFTLLFCFQFVLVFRKWLVCWNIFLFMSWFSVSKLFFSFYMMYACCIIKSIPSLHSFTYSSILLSAHP